MHCPKTYLCKVYAFIVSVMYKQKLLFVPHQQLLLCWVHFFSVQGSIPLSQPPLGKETAPGFLRAETSKHCLTWTLQPCQWYLPSTCTAAESLPWIRCIFFPSLSGFAEAKKTNSPLLPASPRCPGHAVVPLWQLQPSHWHPPPLLSQPTLSGSAP